jgi:hypothetical protein
MIAFMSHIVRVNRSPRQEETARLGRTASNVGTCLCQILPYNGMKASRIHIYEVSDGVGFHVLERRR